MIDRISGGIENREVVPVLLVVSLAEFVSLRYFYPDAAGDIVVLLLLVSLGSLLVVGSSWKHLSSTSFRMKSETGRRTARRRRRRTRRTSKFGNVLTVLYSQGSRRVANIIIMLLFFASLSFIFLTASEIALSVYRSMYALAPESVQPYLESAYGMLRPVMGLGALEKCLLVQNVPAILIGAGSLIISRQQG